MNKEKLLEACLLLAYEAGKRAWQVELEESMDNDQYCLWAIESIHSKRTSTPIAPSSEWREVVYRLRSAQWRKWVRKTSLEYLESAKDLYFASV